jgi:hypothetical protein
VHVAQIINKEDDGVDDVIDRVDVVIGLVDVEPTTSDHVTGGSDVDDDGVDHGIGLITSMITDIDDVIERVDIDDDGHRRVIDALDD